MKQFPEWASMMLKLTGIANACWGLTFTLFPKTFFRWAGMPDPQYIFPWKMIGVVSLVFGVFYFLAAFNPSRRVLGLSMGLVIKLLSLIFMLTYWAADVFPFKFVLYFWFNDLMWLYPLFAALYFVFKQSYQEETLAPQLPLSEMLKRFETHSGKSLKSLSDEQPLLLVFLRHFGCVFCHETLNILRDQRTEIAAEQVQLVLVHMGTPEEAQRQWSAHNLQEVEYTSDPGEKLYRAFRLKKGSFRQLFGTKTWMRRIEAGIFQHHLTGDLEDKARRMPGVFLIYRGEILKSYRHEYISDQPDYIALARR